MKVKKTHYILSERERAIAAWINFFLSCGILVAFMVTVYLLLLSIT